MGNHTQSRKEALFKKRESKRPSRVGLLAGTSKPDNGFGADDPFKQLLKEVSTAARAESGLKQRIETLLSLDGKMEKDDLYLGLTPLERALIPVLEEEVATHPSLETRIFITPMGQTVLELPGEVLPSELVRDAFQAGTISWTSRSIQVAHLEAVKSRKKYQDFCQQARDWCEQQSIANLKAIISTVETSLLRGAPLILFLGRKHLTNFWGENNLPGKTLNIGHKNSVLSSASFLSPTQWSDELVTTLILMYIAMQSGSVSRLEEINGNHLDEFVIENLLLRLERDYGLQTPPWNGSQNIIEYLLNRADLIREEYTKTSLDSNFLIYRKIEGPMVHKKESILRFDCKADASELEAAEFISTHTDLIGSTFDELQEDLANKDLGWLVKKDSDKISRLESSIVAIVKSMLSSTSSDFAMSRGACDITGIAKQIMAEDWKALAGREIEDYYCCVIPSNTAFSYFSSPEEIADSAWAMSSRMRFNSWHFIPGNLPYYPGKELRDYFIPPSFPDITDFSQYHHRGHTRNSVTFAIRSPQMVATPTIDLKGFTDIRLLRCAGKPFSKTELVTAWKASELVASILEKAFKSAFDGNEIAPINLFTNRWHLDFAKDMFQLKDSE